MCLFDSAKYGWLHYVSTDKFRRSQRIRNKIQHGKKEMVRTKTESTWDGWKTAPAIHFTKRGWNEVIVIRHGKHTHFILLIQCFKSSHIFSWTLMKCQINAYLILLIVFRRPLKFRNKVLWITFQSRLGLKHSICISVLSSMFLVEHALVLLFSLLN